MRPDATTEVLDTAEIDRADPAVHSLMPEGLLNELTLEQIADLFAALETVANAGAAPQK